MSDDLTNITANILQNPEAAFSREWLVTNGIGGYASSTVLGANTRSYHGLLVGSYTPPFGRQVLLSKVDEELTIGSEAYCLGVNEYHDGAIHPQGCRFLKSFSLESGVPTWEYSIGGAVLIKQIWMEQGENTVHVLYRLLESPGEVTLGIRPYCAFRSYHGGGQKEYRYYTDCPDRRQLTVESDGYPNSLKMNISSGRFSASGDWYRDFLYRAERDRGFNCLEDLYTPGVFTARIGAGGSVGFTATSEACISDLDIETSLVSELERRRSIIGQESDTLRCQLLLAADQFVVSMPGKCSERKCILAGYHWFTDWGRDTMISLPGILLSAGRFSEAREILMQYGSFIRNGMIPNRFKDDGMSEYNTADATLWYFEAIRRYMAASGDIGILHELFPRLAEVIEYHAKGTDYGIRMDEADGLLWAGKESSQVTWMDACINGCPVTPRAGKPVEINALWYNALKLMTIWAKKLGRTSDVYGSMAEECAVGFRRKFWYKDGGYLFDVVDGCSGSDPSIRPNQIFAVSLPNSPLSPVQRKSVVDVVERALLTPYGLRTLAVEDPAYRGAYRGGSEERDCSYHQGTVWPWLLGHFADAHFRVYKDGDYIRRLLSPFREHIAEAGVGSISEIFDGDAPHTPGGCIAQAWSVGEILRIFTLL